MSNHKAFLIGVLSFIMAILILLTGCQKKRNTNSVNDKNKASYAESSVAASFGNRNSSEPSDKGEKICFYLENTEGKVGKEVTVRLMIKNNPGIAGYSITVEYDSNFLEVVSAENQIIDGFAIDNHTIPGALRLMCTKSGGNTLTENGCCYTVTFKISEKTSPGVLILKPIISDSSDKIYILDGAEMPAIPCVLLPGTLNITE